VITAASGGGTACAGDYTCVAGNGACPVASRPLDTRPALEHGPTARWTAPMPRTRTRLCSLGRELCGLCLPGDGACSLPNCGGFVCAAGNIPKQLLRCRGLLPPDVWRRGRRWGRR
jgi:hypothetical protein